MLAVLEWSGWCWCVAPLAMVLGLLGEKCMSFDLAASAEVDANIMHE